VAWLNSNGRRLNRDEYFEIRADLEVTLDRLAELGAAQSVICSPKGGLTALGCDRALHRLVQLYETPGLQPPRTDSLVIGDRVEMPYEIDYFYDRPTRRSILLVREDVRLPFLRQFAVDKGWLH
jgi:hypothetical protein